MTRTKQAVIGIDIGGTKIAAHISDDTLWSINETTCPTPPAAQPPALKNPHYDHETILQNGREALLTTIIELCESMRDDAPADVEIIGVGIGSAGQINAEAGVVMDAVENLVGWANTPVAEKVGSALNLPVFIENDVRTMAFAESTVGAAKGYQHVLCITVGTGIGGAIILNGQLWRGAHFSAGETGYFYSRPAANGWNNIEQDYAGPGIEREYQRVTQSEHQLSLREIADLARDGDFHAKTTIRNLAHALGTKLAPVLFFLDPEAIVIGGGVPQIGDLWWQHFVAGIRDFQFENVRQMPILKAELGNRAGMVGAGLLAWQRLHDLTES